MSESNVKLNADQINVAHDRILEISNESFTNFNYSQVAVVRNYVRNGMKINPDDFLHEDTACVGEAYRIATNINNDSILNSMGEIRFFVESV